MSLVAFKTQVQELFQMLRRNHRRPTRRRTLGSGLERLEQRQLKTTLGPVDAQPLWEDHPVVLGDFNGDTYQDVAFGLPSRDAGGEVRVMFGGPLGLSEENMQVLHQDFPGSPHLSEDGDGFGTVLAAGDFNGDARDLDGEVRSSHSRTS